MQVKALTRSIIEWDAEKQTSVVINIGETGELPDAIAEELVAGGVAEKVTGKTKPAAPAKPAKATPTPAIAAASTALGEARSRYREAVGKNAGPRWDVATIEAKLAEHLAANPPAAPAETGEGDNDAPPAE